MQLSRGKKVAIVLWIGILFVYTAVFTWFYWKKIFYTPENFISNGPNWYYLRYVVPAALINLSLLLNTGLLSNRVRTFIAAHLDRTVTWKLFASITVANTVVSIIAVLLLVQTPPIMG
jgi:hypothetical protein